MAFSGRAQFQMHGVSWEGRTEREGRKVGGMGPASGGPGPAKLRLFCLGLFAIGELTQTEQKSNRSYWPD